jgi:hypothetical protein
MGHTGPKDLTPTSEWVLNESYVAEADRQTTIRAA